MNNKDICSALGVSAPSVSEMIKKLLEEDYIPSIPNKEALFIGIGIIGSTLAPILFGIALLAAGQSSTITGTYAVQIIMEGFINLRLQPWVRRFVTRILAIAPALFTIL